MIDLNQLNYKPELKDLINLSKSSSKLAKYTIALALITIICSIITICINFSDIKQRKDEKNSIKEQNRIFKKILDANLKTTILLDSLVNNVHNYQEFEMNKK